MTEPGGSGAPPQLDEHFADMLAEMLQSNRALVEVNSQLLAASERASSFESKLQQVRDSFPNHQCDAQS
eukprot:SAG31_NODE_1070_length_10071_cov_6.989771_7_plen_69_part_00